MPASRCGSDVVVQASASRQADVGPECPTHTCSGNLSLALLAGILLLAICSVGCGDQFRPVALPVPLPSPSPSPTHFVAALTTNGDNVLGGSGTCSPSGSPPPCVEDPGAVIRIDVSGDSVSSAFTTGVAPAHATFIPNGSKIYVANSGEDTVSASSATSPSQATTISLPQLCNPGESCPSRPVFVASTENGKMYVANSGNGTVSVINAVSDVVINTVAVDPTFAGSPLPSPNPAANPVTLAELPNGQKLYSVNQGNNTVTSISTLDDTVLTKIAIGAPPIWAVASSDSAFVYVLDTSGTISVIDTIADLVVQPTIPVGAGANFMVFDTTSDRLWVTNPTSATVSIFDVAGSVLTPHAGSPVSITAVPGSGCSSAPAPSAVAVLGDGSRAYVASFQADANTVCSQATVINAGTGAVSSVIPLPPAPNNSSLTGCAAARFRAFAAASPGGPNTNFKVYVSQCDAGSVAVIDTFAANTSTEKHDADVLGAIIPAPVSSFPATQVSISSAAQASGGTTYTYTLLSGPALQQGETISISGMTDASNNGRFVISGPPTSTTFTATNPSGVNTSAAQTGTGLFLPLQNPVFVLPGQ
jgi:YVTN family beta-propeller protein